MDGALIRSIGAGSSPLRTEDSRLLTGRARYVENLEVADVLSAAFLRSPHAHARIRSINIAEAEALNGVVAILTGDMLLAAGVGPLPWHQVVKREDGEPMQPPARYGLATDIVRFSGEAVVLVVAKSHRVALNALDLIEVDYEALPVVVSARAAHQPHAALLCKTSPRNVAGIMRIGDSAATEAAFARAAHVTRLTLTNQRLSANPMETRSVIVACDAVTGRLTLHTGNQAPHMARDQIAAALGIAASNLRISVGDIGGGFGMKLVPYPEEVALLHAARMLKASIRWKADRTESFLSDTHGRDHETDGEMAFDPAGRILGVRLRVFANMGAYLSFFGITVATGSGNRVVSSVYQIPAMDVEVRAMLTNTAPVGPYRGAGRPESIYRIERLLDVAAVEMGMDPVALRRINLVTADQIPYTANSGQIYDSGNFPKVLDAALTVADWDGFPKRKAAAATRGKLYGRGICCHIDTTSGVRPFEDVHLTASADGRVTVFSGTQAMGQGLATVYASMLANQLGLPTNRIDIVQGDTDRVADGVGSYGSRSLFIGGSAVARAGEALIGILRERAADLLGSNSGDIAFERGVFSTANARIAIGELLTRTGQAVAAGRHESKFVFPNGCYISEVEIDPATGVAKVVLFSGVDDIGTVLHPVIVHGQVQGSAAQGIAQALYEGIIYDDEGQLLSASFMDYAVPRADVLPRFHVETDESSPCLSNPLGAKGAGEAGCLGAPPAVVGAVMDALSGYGARHIDMPVTPEKIWRAIRAGASSTSVGSPI
jgi:aerobic carbon-monoxide dehydrogenase large subunit